MSTKHSNFNWLSLPLTCDGSMLLYGLDLVRIGDSDLFDISFRMQVILQTIEMPRCEGRLLPIEIFDRMDDLECKFFHGPTTSLEDCLELIHDFGMHYDLEANGNSIPVNRTEFKSERSRYLDFSEWNFFDVKTAYSFSVFQKRLQMSRIVGSGVDDNDLTMAEFWELAAREGLPAFRWLRRSIPTEQLDKQFENGRLKEEWQTLRDRMQSGDEIWPFEFHVRSYLGMRCGYIVLRNGRPIGGIVTIVS